MNKSKFILIFILISTFYGCGKTRSVFEKRYVATVIPAYTLEDYIRELDSSDSDIRYLAVANIMELEGNDAAAMKIKKLLYDPSSKVRAIAAYALSGVDKKIKIEDTLIDLCKDASSVVREEAVHALGRRYPSSVNAGKAILNAISDPNLIVRLTAYGGVIGFLEKAENKENIVKTLIQKLEGNTSLPEKLMIISLLGYVKHELAEEKIVELLQSPDKRILNASIESLGNLESSLASIKVAALLENEKADKEIIFDALGRMKAENCLDKIYPFLQSKDAELRRKAVSVLSDIESKDALPELKKRFNVLYGELAGLLDSTKILDFVESGDEIILLAKTISDLEKKGKKIKGYLESDNNYERLCGLFKIINYNEPFDRILMEDNEKGKMIFKMIEKLEKDEDPVIKMFACLALGNSVDERVPVILEQNWSSPVFGVSWSSMSAISTYIKNTKDMEVLKRAYETKETYEVSIFSDEDKGYIMRDMLEDAVVKYENLNITLKRLKKEMNDVDDLATSIMAAFHLAKKKDIAAFPVLTGFLKHEKREYRIYAVQGLEYFKEKSLDVLTLALKEEDDKFVKDYISSSIENIKGNSKK